jgi:hypothetical protein
MCSLEHLQKLLKKEIDKITMDRSYQGCHLSNALENCIAVHGKPVGVVGLVTFAIG